MADRVIAEDLRELWDICQESINDPTQFACQEKQVAELIERCSAAEAEVAALAEWKREQLAVEATWDAQAVGKELGVPWGASIRPAILPAIVALKAENERLKAPVSNKEWKACSTFYDGVDHDYDTEAMERVYVDALIAARAGQKGK